MPRRSEADRLAVKEHIRRWASFLLVGVGGAVVDLGLFNLLVYGGPGGGPMYDHPIEAKIIATLAATGLTYLGNAWFTYRDRNTKLSAKQLLAYLVLNGLAIALQAACLAVSRFVLGLDGPVADNIAVALGQVVSTIFRYATYSRWVYRADPDARATAA